MTLVGIHVVAASAWLGLIAGETVIELMANDRTTRRFVARAHRTLDLWFEAPLITLVLATGSVLLWRRWPDVTLPLAVMVIAGVLAIASNVACIHWVLGRARAQDDAEFAAYARKIRWTGYAIPLGVVALGVGLYGV